MFNLFKPAVVLLISITAALGQSAYSGGNGTSDDPYIITTTDDLIELSTTSGDWNKYFIQTADIVFEDADFESGGDFYNDGDGFLPIGDGTTFTGSFDGQGHTIDGLYINRPDENLNGLFDYIGDGGEVSNLGVTNVDLTGQNKMGGLAGRNNGLIENSFATGVVSGKERTGGLVGHNEGTGTIKNSYSGTEVISDHEKIGGLVGDNSNATIKKCYSFGVVDQADEGSTVGGLTGREDGSTTNENSFWDTETSGQTSSQGGGTGKSTSEMQDYNTFTDENTEGLDNAWDFVDDPNNDTGTEDIWNIGSGHNDGYPFLSFETVAPSNHVSSFTAAHAGCYQGDLSWTEDVTGPIFPDGYLIKGSTSGYGDITPPTDGVVENDVGLVKNISSGNTDASLTGLTANQGYYFKVFPYSSFDTDRKYYTGGTVPTAYAETLPVPPTPTSFTADPTGYSDFDLSWDATADYNIMIVYGGTDGGTPPAPTDGAIYAVDDPYNDGESFIGTVIYNGPATADYYFTHTGAEGTNYYYSWHLNTYENYSSFATSNAQAALPITLAKFKGNYQNGKVQLSWKTASETDNARFLIYRDGEVIGSVDGAGTTTEPQEYIFNDHYTIPGQHYRYVLADVSLANVEVQHEQLGIELIASEDGEERDFVIGPAYPNPFNPVTVVPVNLAKEAQVSALLYDMQGRRIAELMNSHLQMGSHTLQIHSDNYPTGMYILRVRVNNALHVQKIVLMK